MADTLDKKKFQEDLKALRKAMEAIGKAPLDGTNQTRYDEIHSDLNNLEALSKTDNFDVAAAERQVKGSKTFDTLAQMLAFMSVADKRATIGDEKLADLYAARNQFRHHFPTIDKAAQNIAGPTKGSLVDIQKITDYLSTYLDHSSFARPLTFTYTRDNRPVESASVADMLAAIKQAILFVSSSDNMLDAKSNAVRELFTNTDPAFRKRYPDFPLITMPGSNTPVDPLILLHGLWKASQAHEDLRKPSINQQAHTAALVDMVETRFSQSQGKQVETSFGDAVKELLQGKDPLEESTVFAAIGRRPRKLDGFRVALDPKIDARMARRAVELADALNVDNIFAGMVVEIIPAKDKKGVQYIVRETSGGAVPRDTEGNLRENIRRFFPEGGENTPNLSLSTHGDYVVFALDGEQFKRYHAEATQRTGADHRRELHGLIDKAEKRSVGIPGLPDATRTVKMLEVPPRDDMSKEHAKHIREAIALIDKHVGRDHLDDRQRRAIELIEGKLVEFEKSHYHERLSDLAEALDREWNLGARVAGAVGDLLKNGRLDRMGARIGDAGVRWDNNNPLVLVIDMANAIQQAVAPAPAVGSAPTSLDKITQTLRDTTGLQFSNEMPENIRGFIEGSNNKQLVQHYGNLMPSQREAFDLIRTHWVQQTVTGKAEIQGLEIGMQRLGVLPIVKEGLAIDIHPIGTKTQAPIAEFDAKRAKDATHGEKAKDYPLYIQQMFSTAKPGEKHDPDKHNGRLDELIRFRRIERHEDGFRITMPPAEFRRFVQESTGAEMRVQDRINDILQPIAETPAATTAVGTALGGIPGAFVGVAQTIVQSVLGKPIPGPINALRARMGHAPTPASPVDVKADTNIRAVSAAINQVTQEEGHAPRDNHLHALVRESLSRLFGQESEANRRIVDLAVVEKAPNLNQGASPTP